MDSRSKADDSPPRLPDAVLGLLSLHPVRRGPHALRAATGQREVGVALLEGLEQGEDVPDGGDGASEVAGHELAHDGGDGTEDFLYDGVERGAADGARVRSLREDFGYGRQGGRLCW